MAHVCHAKRIPLRQTNNTGANKMNVNEIHFGVEFETTMPTNDTTRIGSYHAGCQVDWLPTGWKAERDSSIRCTPKRKACEFVSPKLKGSEGLQQVADSLEQIRTRGAKVNETCGLHVTLEWKGDASALARLISLVGNHEKALYASTGTKRRERVIYTKPIKPYGNSNHAKLKCDSDRYHILNLTHLARGQNRIEFRVFAGTLNTTKVLGYIQMCLGLVELALSSKRCSDWNYTKTEGKRSCWDRPGAGDGETELNRLFYRLGWTKGWYKGELKDKRYGEIAGSDWKAIKAKLMELARKYDQAA
jgi:hypothetical protein